MNVTLWGVRGSLACFGPEITRYGGNTSCVEVKGSDGTILILDAGTGIRRLGAAIPKHVKRVDILITHLHLDHIQGLGFFTPLFDPDMEVHIYGPANSNRHLHTLLTKYLSPPLFPVSLNELPCKLYLHHVPDKEFSIGELKIIGQAVCHPGLTFGYRITSPTGSMAYIPDHELALGSTQFPLTSEWTSGYDLAAEVDLLIHDAQYTKEEYEERVGWGHSTLAQAILFAELAKVKTFVTFHYDPAHADAMLDLIISQAQSLSPHLKIIPGREGETFKI